VAPFVLNKIVFKAVNSTQVSRHLDLHQEVQLEATLLLNGKHKILDKLKVVAPHT
jgi:hypothetical protein